MDKIKLMNDDLFKLINKQIYVVIEFTVYKFKIYGYKIESSGKHNDYIVKLCLSPLDSALTCYYDEEYFVNYEDYKIDWFDNYSDARRRCSRLIYQPKKQINIFEVNNNDCNEI